MLHVQITDLLNILLFIDWLFHSSDLNNTLIYAFLFLAKCKLTILSFPMLARSWSLILIWHFTEWKWLIHELLLSNLFLSAGSVFFQDLLKIFSIPKSNSTTKISNQEKPFEKLQVLKFEKLKKITFDYNYIFVLKTCVFLLLQSMIVPPILCIFPECAIIPCALPPNLYQIFPEALIGGFWKQDLEWA